MEHNRQQGEPRARGQRCVALNGPGGFLPNPIHTLHYLIGKASASEANLHKSTGAGQGKAPPSSAFSVLDTF